MNFVLHSVWLAIPVLLSSCGASTRRQARGSEPSAVPFHDHAVLANNGQTVVIRTTNPMDVSLAGCADGSREAFHDLGRFPSVAGCEAMWNEARSLRAQRTGVACGNLLGPCAAPADACSAGWHLCGASGALDEVRRVSAQDCASAGNGRFAAAISHCSSQEGCNYNESLDAHYACFDAGWCSEPVCCGNHCGTGMCPSGVWADSTHISDGPGQGCGNTLGERAGGVLCCRD